MFAQWPCCRCDIAALGSGGSIAAYHPDDGGPKTHFDSAVAALQAYGFRYMAKDAGIPGFLHILHEAARGVPAQKVIGAPIARFFKIAYRIDDMPHF